MLASSLSPRELLNDGPILLYDGECGVCSRSVQWILAHERRHSLRFAPLKSALGRALSAEAKVSEDVDSLLWVEASEHGVRARFWSNAVFATLGYVGGPWRLLALLKVVPTPVRDYFYRTFARHRLKVAPPVCLVPRAEARARFLST